MSSTVFLLRAFIEITSFQIEYKVKELTYIFILTHFLYFSIYFLRLYVKIIDYLPTYNYAIAQNSVIQGSSIALKSHKPLLQPSLKG